MSAVTVDLPEDILARAQRLALERQMPLDQIVADAVAGVVAAWEQHEYFQRRVERGRHVDIKAILDKAPDVEPDPSDRIE